MTDAQVVLVELSESFKLSLRGLATVSLEPSRPEWRSRRLLIHPMSERAAPIRAWEDNASIAILAGVRALIIVDGASDQALIDSVREKIDDVVNYGLVDRFLGPIYPRSQVAATASRTKAVRSSAPVDAIQLSRECQCLNHCAWAAGAVVNVFGPRAT